MRKTLVALAATAVVSAGLIGLSAPANAADNPGPIFGVAGKCVDIQSSGTANGTKVQLWTCNGSGAESWTISGGTVKGLGKCLDVAGGGTANATKVQLWTCNGSGAQAWTYSGGVLKNTKSGKCLDVPSADPVSGVQLQIWTCNASNAQYWTRLRSPLYIDVDSADAPDTAQWALDGRSLMTTWHPKIAALLPSSGWAPPNRFRLYMDPDYDGVAYADGNTITVAAAWVRAHPTDIGLLVHEEVHILQQNKSAPSWLIEGTADWIRYFQYEHKDIKPAPGQTYLNGYGTAAYFLNWVSTTYDSQIISKLNAAGRNGTYTESLWVTYTGKTPQQLWDEMPKPTTGFVPSQGVISKHSEIAP